MKTLNIRCGDDLRGRIAGDYLSFVDPLCQGPIVGPGGSAPFIERRARFVADHYGVAFRYARARLMRETGALAHALDYDRVVLWFEHDLFDQAILAYLLDWYARHRLSPGVLRLVEIDRHPRIARFIGLGQLTPDELAALGRAAPIVTPERLRGGRAAWRAYAARSPLALHRLTQDESAASPLFAAAARRHLQEFPWTRDGLSLTQRLALAMVADGAWNATDVFTMLQQGAEPQPFLGDSMFFSILHGLLVARAPALAGNASTLVITKLGHALLAGEADWVRANGIDRWLGGVHLRGPEAQWRWDDGAECVVALETPRPPGR